MQDSLNNKPIFFKWSSYSRCFEKKSNSYFRLIFLIGVFCSLLALFFGEGLLVLVVWALVFVAWVSNMVPPPIVEHKIDKFGLQINNLFLPTVAVSAFTVVKKRNCYLLRLFVSSPNGEVFVVLPDNSEQRRGIIDYLQTEIAFIEKVPKTEVEKIADFLGKITFLNS